MYPSIIYWKWDDSHIDEKGKAFRQIDDIVQRSVFSHIYITTHWCRSGISTEIMREKIAAAAEYIHSKGRKFIFEIDARAEKSVFCQSHPKSRIGFLYRMLAQADSSGNAVADFDLPQSSGELFLGDRSAGDELVDCRIILPDGSSQRAVGKLNPGLSGRAEAVAENVGEGSNVYFCVCRYLDFPDFSDPEFFEFFDGLFREYKDIKLDGVALDEMGYPWHPKFDFSHNTYTEWNNSPLYGRSFACGYRNIYGTEYLDDVLEIFLRNDEDSTKQRAVNRYFEYMRKTVARTEEFFYDKAKEYFGRDCFIGVHPTWYAIEEVANTPEVWKNGIDWYEVPRDYGFTDEIMIYPVRLALAHRCGSPLFYNMWYGESTNDLGTYFPEIWRNARMGGRTISLGYECVKEPGQVLELKAAGKLEAVSAAEERIAALDKLQKTAARSDIAIITGAEASCNIACNRDGNGKWNSYDGVFKSSFILARDIFNLGYNCDYILNYEVYNGRLRINSDGYLQYGSQEYRFAVLYCLQFSKRKMLEFMDKLKASKTQFVVIGRVDRDFDGGRMYIPCDFELRPQAFDLVPYFEASKAEKNRLPSGCVLQDGAMIFTAPSTDKPCGNVFTAEFRRDDECITFTAEDFAYVPPGSTEIFTPALIHYQTKKIRN